MRQVVRVKKREGREKRVVSSRFARLIYEYYE